LALSMSTNIFSDKIAIFNSLILPNRCLRKYKFYRRQSEV
jgi:hypothetical protein